MENQVKGNEKKYTITYIYLRGALHAESSFGVCQKMSSIKGKLNI